MNKNKNHIFTGLFFVALAALILLSTMGYLGDITAISAILGLFFLCTFIHGVVRLKYWEFLFSLAFLGIIFDRPLGIENLTPFPILLIALFLSIGLSIIFHRKRTPSPHYNNQPQGTNFNGGYPRGDGNKVLFGSKIIYYNEPMLDYTEVGSNFASLRVFFDKTTAVAENATICSQCNFAELHIFLPTSWNVINNINPTFGSVVIDRHNTPSDSPAVVLTGECNLGSIKVHFI